MQPSLRSLARVLTCLSLLMPISTRAQVPEADLKAAFIYNFALFTQWPPSPPASPANFCVDQGSALKAAIQALAGKPMGDRRVEVRLLLAGAAAPADCGVWITGPASTAPRAEPAATLVIYDGGSFDGHVMIVLVLDDAHVRFDIDTLAAQKAGLRFSSKLLRLARTTR